MAASPKQIAANRQNALKSTGPRSEEGKAVARRNALKHGMTGGGVVLSGEDEHELPGRIAAMEAELAPEGSVTGALLVRQAAIASIRVERAYRHETALAAERMRRAGDVFDDDRQSLAEQMLAEMPLDPATCRRRLLMAAVGVDALVGRLRVLREKAGPQTFIAWDQAEGDDLDRCLGWRPEGESKSRVGLLTRAIVYDHWVGLDPAETAGMTQEARLLWAVGAIHAIITAEIAALEAHREALDPTRAIRGRAEAAERSLLDLDKEGTALRRYAGAAERTMLRMMQELRSLRAEADLRAAQPAAVAEVLHQAAAPQGPDRHEVRGESASFGPVPRPAARPEPKRAVASHPGDLMSSFVPITVGRSPRLPTPTGP